MSNGTKDYDAASMFYEQLLYLDKDANFVRCAWPQSCLRTKTVCWIPAANG